MNTNKRKAKRTQPGKMPKLCNRPLLNNKQAMALMELFKILGNETRLRILHSLVRNGEFCVGDIARELDMRPQAISNQLRRLALQGIVGTRRDSNNIYYRVLDPCIGVLLERGICLMEDTEERLVLRSNLQAMYNGLALETS